MDLNELPENIPEHLLLELDQAVAEINEIAGFVNTLAWCAPFLDGLVTVEQTDTEQ